MNAYLALEDGTVFKGAAFGASGEHCGEVVFNTSMTGYQEIITDPSYKGQIVTMTYPLIGNYGVNAQDVESRTPFVEGFVVREYSKIASSWRHEKSLGDYLCEHDIIGLEGIDTRQLTLHIRQHGAMKAVLSTVDMDEQSLIRKARASAGLLGRDLVKEVSSGRKYIWQNGGKPRHTVVVVDCGVKFNILRELMKRSCKVIVVPASATASQILEAAPDGVVFSNGPGDPAALAYIVETAAGLIGKTPVFGICLGHQILGQAFGGATFKLKFGHHGANHPVKDVKTGKVCITAQNHGFCVDIHSLKDRNIEITHINLNDNTLEGMRHKKLPVFSVQFHPEASPGPHDSEYLFDEFIVLMEKHRKVYR